MRRAIAWKTLRPSLVYGLAEVVRFFRTGKPPVSAEETIEIYAFMEAADESKRRGGTRVKLDTVLSKARQQARQRLEELHFRR